MIVDTSVLVAGILEEPGNEPLLAKLMAHGAPRVGAPTLCETGMVLVGREGTGMRAVLRRFVAEYGVLVLPFEREHVALAVEAFVRFGKGRHPARLNLGDCCTYAVARRARAPLLCIGDDFAQADLALVI